MRNVRFNNKKTTQYLSLQTGSAVVMLLVSMAMFMIVTSAAITISYINNQAISSETLGDEALHAAESGADEALIKLIRSNTYTGQSLTIDNADVTITVSDSGPQKVIDTEAALDSYLKKVQVVASFSSGSLSIDSWKEVD